MDLEIFKVKEVNEKHILHMITLICGIYKKHTNELIYKAEIELQS